jgi:hypothetical protein
MSESIDLATAVPANDQPAPEKLPFKLPLDRIDGTVEQKLARAREDFDFFRVLMSGGDMLTNWWTIEINRHLKEFYKDLKAGKRPKLALMAPPQHGKSKAVNDFTAWVAGVNPNIKVIFTSYSDELGARANVELQRAIKSPMFSAIFGRTVIGLENWVCNQSLIEYSGYKGSFRNVTIQGGVTGFSLDLGIIDDYVKDRAEANSATTRQKVWEWFVDVFQTRMSKDSALLIVCTRWHVDDLLGRYLERNSDLTNLKVLRYPAIAEEDTDFRAKGVALFPEFKPLDLLLERKHEMSIGSWEAEYQQHPVLLGGGQLPVDKLRVVPSFARENIMSSVRYVDKAGTVSDDAAYSAFVLMHVMKDKTYVIEHIERGRWAALEREDRLKTVCQNDNLTCPNYRVWVEQEPGSGGKESVESGARGPFEDGMPE